MANADNQCKDLEVKDFYGESTTHLADIMEHQKEMQEKTYGFNFEDMSLRDVMNFWHVTNHAMIDEIHEMTDALGGINERVFEQSSQNTFPQSRQWCFRLKRGSKGD